MIKLEENLLEQVDECFWIGEDGWGKIHQNNIQFRWIVIKRWVDLEEDECKELRSCWAEVHKFTGVKNPWLITK